MMMSTDAFALLSSKPNHSNLPPPPSKKKRNLPGNPDPDAEVIALSPQSLMATNRFICEVCNKGFRRDQNLQLHRRGHNLPWKLRQRVPGKEMKKKVYICPEPSCVHHDPARALGDLTGIKKHFSRKHGEKKWKCDRCSKRYAVRSDWKAHLKTCGTREYKCDCGVVFSRKDSFITHRAFCDALTQESAKLSMVTYTDNSEDLKHDPLIYDQLIPAQHADFSSTSFTVTPPVSAPTDTAFTEECNPQLSTNQFNQNATPAYLSATALLQKAAEMGASISSPSSSLFCGLMGSIKSKKKKEPQFFALEKPMGGFQELMMMSSSGSGATRDFLGLGRDGSSSSKHFQDMAKFGYNVGPGLDHE